MVICLLATAYFLNARTVFFESLFKNAVDGSFELVMIDNVSGVGVFLKAWAHGVKICVSVI